MAELVREGVQRVLAEQAEEERWQRATSIAGQFHSGHTMFRSSTMSTLLRTAGSADVDVRPVVVILSHSELPAGLSH